jgi:hypothetical protein
MEHGSVAQKIVAVKTNLFLLKVTRQALYHYDISFDRKRSGRGQDPGAVVCCHHLAAFA